MTKKITALLLALIFASSVGLAAAATITCTVETVTDGKVTLDCGNKAEKLTIGSSVKVKPVTARKGIEGC